jgi:hypothetical protein
MSRCGDPNLAPCMRPRDGATYLDRLSSTYVLALESRSQNMTILEERAASERVTDCPAKGCDGRALITYDPRQLRSPSVRIIAQIACDQESCKYFPAAKSVP